MELFVPPIGDGEQEQEMGDIVKRFLNKETERLSLQGPGRSIMWVTIEAHIGFELHTGLEWALGCVNMLPLVTRRE